MVKGSTDGGNPSRNPARSSALLFRLLSIARDDLRDRDDAFDISLFAFTGPRVVKKFWRRCHRLRDSFPTNRPECTRSLPPYRPRALAPKSSGFVL